MGTKSGTGAPLESATEINTIDMQSIVNLTSFDRISILKIDIEGSERELFALHSDQWLDRVDNIVVELHGDACRHAFFGAIANRPFEISACGELTVCLSKSAAQLVR